MSNVEQNVDVAETPVVTNNDRYLATQFFMKNASNINSARQEMLGLGIKTSYDADVMIFSTLHSSKKELNNVYAQECNGLVLEQKTWRPLVVPCRNLRFNIKTELSNQYLHQGLYRIYKVQDGTCFNMYYYKNEWIISTAKGYNMNNVCWNNNKTYKAIVVECLEKIGLTWETFTSQLDVKKCYSFGFKHPDFHKFFEGKESEIYRIWFIQSVNLDTTSDQYLWASDKSPIAIVENQTPYTEPVNNLKELYKQASCSLENFLANGSICYGYILRSVNFETTGYHSDLFIESALMRTIRQTWYENNIIDLCHKNKWDKTTVITLNAYLDPERVETFLILFKQYVPLVATYSEVVNEVVNEMVVLSKNLPENTSMTAAGNLLRSFTSHIKYNLSNKSDVEKQKTFMNFVLHCSSLEYIIPLIMQKQDAKQLDNSTPFTTDLVESKDQ